MTHSKDLRYFDNNSDDVTGWTVRSYDGTYLGKVARLLADVDTNYVVAVVLDDGRELRAHDVSIGFDELTLAKPMATAKPAVATTPKPVAAAPPPPAKPALAAVPAQPPPKALTRDDEDVVLQLVDEEIDVGKRSYETGGVHVETHIISEPIEKEVRINEERVSVQRTKVDRTLEDAAANALFRDQNYEIRATAEVPVVKKFAHVVEEVVVKREAFDRDEKIRDTVRHMEADITELRASEALQGVRR